MATTRHRQHTQVADHPLQGADDDGDRGVTDDMEAGGDAGLGACPQVRDDGLGVQVAKSAVAGVVVLVVQPRGV